MPLALNRGSGLLGITEKMKSLKQAKLTPAAGRSKEKSNGYTADKFSLSD
jgi:hypothetical protein